MKTFASLALILSAAPALAHTSALPHSHAEGGSALPLLLGLLAISAAAAIAWVQR